MEREAARGTVVEMKLLESSVPACTLAQGLILIKMFRQQFLFISAELLSKLKLWLGIPIDPGPRGSLLFLSFQSLPKHLMTC